MLGRARMATAIRSLPGKVMLRPLSSKASTTSGSALGAVESGSEISTLKLYRDCMRLTYHIAAQAR